MSIYATLWSIRVQDPSSSLSEPRWVKVTAQAVPAHIGAPTPGCGYEGGDPYAAFLPPPVETNELGEAEHHRAVVFVREGTHKGTARNGQEYVDPLFVLSGKQYAAITFDELLRRLAEAVRGGPRVIAEYIDGSGEHRVFTEDE